MDNLPETIFVVTVVFRFCGVLGFFINLLVFGVLILATLRGEQEQRCLDLIRGGRVFKVFNIALSDLLVAKVAQLV